MWCLMTWCKDTFFPFISHDLSSRQKRPVIVNVFFLDCLFVNYFTPYAEMPSTSPNCIAHNVPNLRAIHSINCGIAIASENNWRRNMKTSWNCDCCCGFDFAFVSKARIGCPSPPVAVAIAINNNWSIKFWDLWCRPQPYCKKCLNKIFLENPTAHV